MNRTDLALLGGKPVIESELEHYFNSIGDDDEVADATEVIRSGVLSAYIGAPGEGFMGGTHVEGF